MDYDISASAAQIVETLRRQNWKNGGVLMVDEPDALEYVEAQLRLAQRSGEIIGVERLRDVLAL
jgi:hypothetical protein